MLRGIKEKFKKPRDEEAPVEDVVDDNELEELDDEWEEYDEEEEEPRSLKSRIIRGLVGSFVAILLLSGLAIGGGAAYVWYVGENSLTSGTAIAQPVEPTVRKEVKRVQRDPNAAFGVSVQMLTTPVLPGSNAGITVKSVDGVTCKIVVEINKVPLVDSGLADKPADEYGIVTWSWTVPQNAPVGKWPVKVACTSAAKKSAVVQGDMEVVKTLPEN